MEPRSTGVPATGSARVASPTATPVRVHRARTRDAFSRACLEPRLLEPSARLGGGLALHRPGSLVESPGPRTRSASRPSPSSAFDAGAQRILADHLCRTCGWAAIFDHGDHRIEAGALQPVACAVARSCRPATAGMSVDLVRVSRKAVTPPPISSSTTSPITHGSHQRAPSTSGASPAVVERPRDGGVVPDRRRRRRRSSASSRAPPAADHGMRGWRSPGRPGRPRPAASTCSSALISCVRVGVPRGRSGPCCSAQQHRPARAQAG